MKGCEPQSQAGTKDGEEEPQLTRLVDPERWLRVNKADPFVLLVWMYSVFSTLQQIRQTRPCLS